MAARESEMREQLLVADSKHRPSLPQWTNRVFYALSVRQFKWVLILVLLLLSLGVVALFVYNVIVLHEKAPSDWSFIMAHTFAQLTKLFAALCLLPVMRALISRLGETRLGAALHVFGYHVAFHKLCGRLLLLSGLGHSAAWFARWITFGWSSMDTDPTTVSNSSLQAKLPEFITGFVCLFTLLIVYFGSLAIVRRRWFEAFYVSHWCWLIFYIALYLHGINFYYWGSLPLLMWLVDYIWRTRRSHLIVREVEACLLPGGVLQIEFMRKDFEFTAGQFVFVNCPAISKHEWHPFTISSSPNDFCITLHLKIAGDWTRRVAAHLAPVTMPSYNSDTRMTTVKGPQIFKIDGPFGAPSQGYTQFEHVVFVGAGIGNTPFVSVLRYLRGLLLAQKSSQDLEAAMADDDAVHPDKPNDMSSNDTAVSLKTVDTAHEFPVKSVYFAPIISDQDSLLWFSDILSILTSMPGRFLRISLFLTHLHESQPPDIDLPRFDSGICPRLFYGRPNFDKLMLKIANKVKQGEVGVFFCGPNAAATALEDACIKHSTREVQLVFHKEIF